MVSAGFLVAGLNLFPSPLILREVKRLGAAESRLAGGAVFLITHPTRRPKTSGGLAVRDFGVVGGGPRSFHC